ncbi:MAG: type II secretion system F family protein [Defluviitaleaceae bacterium]|nr:type II secretion system F family protein [Defluviitaleaceae bacterium]
MKAPSKTDLAFFANQLSFLIDSEMPLKQGLLHIQNAASKKLSLTISFLIESLESGKKLHESLRGFPTFFIYMVKAGEEAGNLAEVLEKLAEHYEKEQAREKEIGGLMIYPMFVLFALVIVIVITTLFLVPNFTMFFAEQGVELPSGTQALVYITDFMQTSTFLIILAFAFVTYVFLHIERSFLDKILFRILRKQLTITFSYRLSMALKVMLAAEVPILEALEISKYMVSNTIYHKKVQKIHECVESGKNLGDSLAEAGIFHYNLTGMAITGEASGFLTESLEKCALFLEKEQKQSVEKTKKLIEPILTVTIGAVLFFIMLALMMPTFAIMEVL